MNHKTFSIIIPTCNRFQQLADCLESLVRIDYPKDCFEVIIVDDGGQICIEKIIVPFQNQLNLRLLTQSNSGPAIARNTGASVAKGEFLVFTDDDCIVRANWLQILETQFMKTPDYLIGGLTLNRCFNNPYSTASQQLVDYIYSKYNAIPHEAKFFTSNNFSARTEIFRKIGGFNTAFSLPAGEDREFCNRWIHSGYGAIYLPQIVIYHSYELTLNNFWKQQFNYGRGAFLFQRTSNTNLQHPSFYLDLLTYPFSQSSGQLVIAGLFLISQVAIAIGFFYEKTIYRIK